jgi:hypothetical protein
VAWFSQALKLSPDNGAMPAPTTAIAPTIVLCTLNAKYIHASLGLRYLLANMERHGSAALRQHTVLREFTIHRLAQQVVDELLAALGPVRAGRPVVIGFGVYIWNTTQTADVIRLLKAQRPDIVLVLGGPEVSHETEQQDIVALAHHVITGWGDVSFPRLCLALLDGPKPLMKIIPGVQPPLEDLALPYDGYSDADLEHRVLYVEASRGCPFKCEFCLSSLDKTAWAFPLEPLLEELDLLHARGARHFKFVDRTFNLKVEASVRILQFFLDRMSPELQLHFEVVPDHLPQPLKDLLQRFPKGVLQLEVGIQSFNEAVQQRISRRQDNLRTEANLRWLVQHTQAHLHTDLIFGLPGEGLDSFGLGFDRLWALQPQEIQLGLLKRLRGTPIARHTQEFAMVYDAQPPYAVQQTGALDAATVQRFVRLARYWDLVANSGRFPHTLALLLGPSKSDATQRSVENTPFQRFLAFSDWLWQATAKTHGLTPESLLDRLFSYLHRERAIAAPQARTALLADYLGSGARANPQALQGLLPRREAPLARRSLTQRQQRHAG